MNIVQGLSRRLRSAHFYVQLLRHGVRFSRPLHVSGHLPLVRREGTMEIGAGLHLYGEPERAMLVAGPGARLSIGRNCLINSGSQIHAVRAITIGDHCLIAPNCAISDTDFHVLEEGRETRIAPVVIGRNVWLGRNATVLPGTTIGDHSMVGAGAVVSGVFPARSLILGVPGRVVRTLNASDGFHR